jgi:glutathionylspermidine synthase
MQISITAGRQDYKLELTAQGLVYSDTPVLEADGKRSLLTYWEERNYFAFSESETDLLAGISDELYQMLIGAGDYVVERLKRELPLTDPSRQIFAQLFGIPAVALQAVIDGWDGNSPSAYGRFDLSPVLRNGEVVGAKMLEFNGQTATGMPETDFQHAWMLANFPAEDYPRLGQWSGLFDKLVIVWWREVGRYLAREGKDKLDTLHFTYSNADSSGEDELNVKFQAAAAEFGGRLLVRVNEARSQHPNPESFDEEIYVEALMSEPSWLEVLKQYECPFRVKIFYIEDVVKETNVSSTVTSYGTMPMVQAIDFNSLTGLSLAHIEQAALYDHEREPIELMFSLYTWEWLLEQPLGPVAMRNTVQYDGVRLNSGVRQRTTWIEPPYKLLWTKAILPVLWLLYKDDPVRRQYLLESYFDNPLAPEELLPPRGFRSRRHVRKPIFGREGKGVTITEGDTVIETELGHPSTERDQIILQEFTSLPEFDTLYGPMKFVLGIFMADINAAAMLIRGSSNHITTDTCKFFCHIIEMGK